MDLWLDILNLFSYFPFLHANEEDITHNITILKKEAWFQELKTVPAYEHLLIQDRKIRNKIGRFKTKKLQHPSYQRTCQRKLLRALHKRSGVLMS